MKNQRRGRVTDLKEWALAYAKLGWKIFPLRPGLKTPLTQHGVKDSSSELSQIEDWWAQWPNANIGLACGEGSGVYVIDIDVNASKRIDGFKSIEDHMKGVPFELTVAQKTPSGGRHMLFAAAGEKPSNSNGLLNGVDIRAEGYYIVLAPSHLEPYGKCPDGGSYAWQTDLAPWDHGGKLRILAAYPEVMRLSKKATPAENLQPQALASVGQTRPAISPQTLPFILERARLWLQEADPAVTGCCGHEKLFWACQGMVNGFCLCDADAYRLVATEYNPRCSPPWNFGDPREEREFARKITQARENPPRDKPIGWLLDDALLAAGSEIDINGRHFSLITEL